MILTPDLKKLQMNACPGIAIHQIDRHVQTALITTAA